MQAGRRPLKHTCPENVYETENYDGFHRDVCGQILLTSVGKPTVLVKIDSAAHWLIPFLSLETLPESLN